MVRAWRRKCPAGAVVVVVGTQESGRPAVAVGNGNDMLRLQGGVLGSADTAAEAARIVLGSGPESAARNLPVGSVHSALGRSGVPVEGLAAPGSDAPVWDIWASRGTGIAADCCCIGYREWHSRGAGWEECM